MTRPPEVTTARHSRAWRRARVAWAAGSVFVVASLALGLAAVPAVAFWRLHLGWQLPAAAEVFVHAMALVPAYLLFAAGLMVHAALAARLLHWRTIPGLEARLGDYEWPVLGWARYLILTHVVRVFAGPPFRATPVWTMYLRLNGARVGRGAWINSLALMDHCLLEIGDHVVIGSDAHVSGHTVEAGVLKTASVRIGARSTIGIGSVIGIGTLIGPDVQVGALSVVSKHSMLTEPGVYLGAPARRFEE